MARVKALIDLNVIMDVLQARRPFYDDSAQVLALAESGRMEGWVSAHSLTTLFYLYAKSQSPAAARIAITQLLQFLQVAPVDQSTIEQALNLPYADFEDAMQMIAALHRGADYVVTRNPQDYIAGPLPVLLPGELLALVD